MEHLVIGIAGGTGSGKTTLANRIYEHFSDQAVLINMDCYYKDHQELAYEQRVKINYDHPDAFETQLLLQHIKQLKNGQTIKHPTYDFTAHLRSSDWVEVESKKLIIVEGILVFDNKQLVDLFDVKIFVDTDADVRILRRICRDVKERGRSLDSIVNQYLQTVKPMHEKYIEPSKKVADIIVLEGGHNDVASDMIIDSIRKKFDDDKI